ncbi:MAG TPA: hydrolase [Bacillus sp. (in: firmicutes)]|uniref:hydrolase n=1 Tax=Bacillus litorisediminis TaxID=2922713 RepID=UPI001FAE3513|nr:hydrolase [Bacillus litorisediminis]HWO75048.1 hydrolase [Bacillus sp. (in: firmicutes)]
MVKQRFFQLDTEWNVIHYPEKPNGFGVLIFGGEGHFVEEKNSFWLQHMGRNIWLKALLEAGYTVFYSNLYGNHWGSEKAGELAESLYHYVIRHEILNERIHIIAEGMGALLIPELVKNLEGNIRTVSLINPYFSLKEKMDEEKEQLFFYKKFLHEVKVANLGAEDRLQFQTEESIRHWTFPQVLSIFFVMDGNRTYSKKRLMEELVEQRKKKQTQTMIHYILPERRNVISSFILRTFKNFEEI